MTADELEELLSQRDLTAVTTDAWVRFYSRIIQDGASGAPIDVHCFAPMQGGSATLHLHLPNGRVLPIGIGPAL